MTCTPIGAPSNGVSRRYEAGRILTSNNLGSNYEGQSKYMIAFYKAYLEDDKRYLEILTGPKVAEISTLTHSP